MHKFTLQQLTKSCSAWVSISGRVFVSNDELSDRLAVDYPLLAKQAYETDDSVIDLASQEQIHAAFEAIASEKISEHFPTDEPVKFNESVIDMTTFRS